MEIEKSIPAPQLGERASRFGRKPKYPFRDMAIGDSILVDGNSSAYTDCPANNAAAQYAYKTGKKFTAEAQGNGKVRIWRIA